MLERKASAEEKQRLFDPEPDKDEKNKLLKDVEAQKEEKPAATWGELYGYAKLVDWLMIFLGSAGATIAGASFPVVMVIFGNMINVFVDYAISGDKGALMSNALEFFIYYMLLGFLAFFCGYLEFAMWMWAGERQTKVYREKYYAAIVRQDIGWFDTIQAAELTTRLTSDCNAIQEGISQKVGQVIQSAAGFFAGMTIAFWKSWRLTLVMLAVMPFLAICGAFLAKVMSSLSNKSQSAYAAAGAVAEEVLSSIKTVVAFGGEKRESDRYNHQLDEVLAAGIKKGLVVAIGLGITFCLLFFSYGIAFYYGGTLFESTDPSKHLSPGDVLTVFFSIIIGAFSLGQIAPNMADMVEAKVSAKRALTVIDRIPPIDSASSLGKQLPNFTGNIEFRDVCFTYPTRKDKQVLSGLSFKVNAGQTLALVGSSGCGKSTVVALLERFYDIESGEILLDGQKIDALSLRWLRNSIGLVSQEPALFNLTIRENIALGLEGATDQQIEEAAREANAHSFIMAMPHQYDTVVGERGTQLSGGQKQRIAIARALIKKPKILLLDEATSALDTESEKIVQEALDKVSKGRTTIVIAHRLSTIQNADAIAVVDQGRICEVGRHTDLMERKGMYFELVMNQNTAGGLPKAQAAKVIQQELRTDSSPVLGRSALKKSNQAVAVSGSINKANAEVEEVKEDDIYPVSLSRIAAMNKPEWASLLLGLCGATLNGCLMPAFSIIFSEVINIFALTGEDFKSKSLFWSLMFGVLGIATFLANFFQVYFFTRAGEKLTDRLRKNSFHHMLVQDISWHDREENSTGMLTTRLATDATLVQGMLGQRWASIVQSAITAIAGLGIAFYTSWLLTLIILACVPFIGAAGYFQMRFLSGFTDQSRKAYEKSGEVASESIGNIRTVVSLARENTFQKRYKSFLVEPFNVGVMRAHLSGVGFGLSQLFIFGTYAVAFYSGAYLISLDKLDFLQLMRTFSAVVFCAMTVGQSSSLAPDYTKARVAAGNIFRLLDSQPTTDAISDDTGEKAVSVSGDIRFSGVSFVYPTRPGVSVLKNFNLHIRPGQTLALVGASGGGKSTVVSLLERFYDPASGEITLDGNNVRRANLKWLRSQMGIVSQEPVLFGTSIAANIEYGKPGASLDEIRRAAMAANIHDFITTLALGYETPVGEKGTQLSGGQKQRIAIARALIRNPRILLLDEATSALDTASEKVVQEALDKARVGRTTIVIAHRLSTVQSADCIAVIKNGAIAELGNHSELLAQGGLYASLLNQQQLH